MTLVIGRICGGALRIDSDSKITDPRIVSNRNNIFSGLLKSVILSPHICVSYAGDVAIAQNAIEELYKLSEISIKNVKNLLLKIHIESDSATDFLIGSLESQALIYKIQNCKIEVSNQNFWIGDIKGFELFQSLFFPKIKSTDPSKIFEAHADAFEEVLSSNLIDGIGGFHICVHSRPLLQYQLKTTIFNGRPFSITVSGNATFPIPFGNAQSGSFATSYLPSVDIYKPAIGIHFPFGNFGTLYYPKISRELIIIRDVNGNEFIEKVKNMYQLSLGGLTLG